MFDASAERVPDSRYRGMNPKFVHQVWAKKRLEAKPVKMPVKREAAPVEREPDAIDIILKRAVEKYGVIKTPRQKIREDIEAIAKIYGIAYSDIMSKSHMQIVVQARSACFWMLQFTRGMTLPEIGRVFGMDHTAVLAGINRHIRRLDPEDPRAQWAERKRINSSSRIYYQRKTDRPYVRTSQAA